MKKRILVFLLIIARLCGGFRVARWITRGDLRILCYHGAALADEYRFRGGLFIEPGVFAERMQHLSEQGYPVLSLDEALQRLAARTLPACATVITIDDGWIGTRIAMAPTLKQFSFPATLYLATYYVEKQTQIFHVAADYALWKAPRAALELKAIDARLAGIFDTREPTQRDAAVDALWALADSFDDAGQRQQLLHRVCDAVGMDAAAFEASRLISFMSAMQVRELSEFGIDVQLHTHRHRFPTDDFAAAEREIADNRASLAQITSRPLKHFCYPNGAYQASQLPWMAQLGITSATSTRPGFNRSAAARFELLRFLDSQSITPIEFEAEMSGFLELIRRCGYSI